MEDQARTRLGAKIHADDAGRGLEVDRMAAPAVGRATRRRRWPEPKERPHWWRTRRGRSYTLHTAEALAEDQSRRSGGTSEDWGWRGGTGGGPGPMDIEVARRWCHEPTAVRPEFGLGWPGSTLRWTGTPCRAASLDCPDGARREVPAGARLDRAEGGGSRWTGPTQSRSQDVLLEVGSRYGAKRQR